MLQAEKMVTLTSDIAQIQEESKGSGTWMTLSACTLSALFTTTQGWITQKAPSSLLLILLRDQVAVLPQKIIVTIIISQGIFSLRGSRLWAIILILGRSCSADQQQPMPTSQRKKAELFCISDFVKEMEMRKQTHDTQTTLPRYLHSQRAIS